MKDVATFTAAKAKWTTHVGTDCGAEHKILLADCTAVRGQARGTEMEFWICRITMGFGTALNLRDVDKAIYKKKLEFDNHRLCYVSHVWKRLREVAKPALDRGLAKPVAKQGKETKKASKKAAEEHPSPSD